MNTRISNRLLTAFLLALIAGTAFAQEDRLETARESFTGASLPTKLEILRMTERDDPAEFGPLYYYALKHVLNNAERIRADRDLRDLAFLAMDRIQAGTYRPAANDLWRLYQVHQETSFRIRVLEVLATMGGESTTVVEGVIDWVRRQHVVSQAGGSVDFQVLASAAKTLGEFGDPRAYTALLDTVLYRYPGYVTAPARESLGRLEGDMLEFALTAVRSRPPADRRPVFSLLLDMDHLDDAERLELAREVLRDAVGASASDLSAQEELRQTRFLAARILREGSYSDAAREVIRHFNQTVLEFERRRIGSAPLLEAIAAVGAMGTEEASARLTDYLDLLNTYTESDRPFDTQVVLAVIANLELLGFPGSYNVLSYTYMLENYPRRVRDRAEQAMSSVRQ